MKKILSVFILLFMGIGFVGAVYEPDKSHSVLKKNEIIYFDASGLDWQHVYIHIWEKDGEVYKDWANNDEMTKVEGTDNIYSFTLPDDIDEKYNMIIFHNEYGGNANQTIDLAHIDDKYAYLTTGFSDEKRIGYWYLYDKDELVNRLNILKQYQSDKDYYIVSSYANLDELINSLEQALENEIILEQDTTDPSKYYILVDYTFGDADVIVNALEVNTDLLSDLISQEENNYSNYETEYTKDSLDDLKEIINSQKVVLNGNNITVNDIKSGISIINQAKNNLVSQADKTALKKQLNEISELDKDKYTEESFKNLEDLLDSANEILDDTNKSQDEVNEMVNKLKETIEKLKEKEVKEQIEEAIKEEVKEKNDIKEVEVPKTLDDIVKVFAIFGVCTIVLVIVVIALRKINK